MEVKGRLDESIISMFVRQILEGLHELHQHDIIHNNIKPSNILLFPNSIVKLSDCCLEDIFIDKIRSK